MKATVTQLPTVANPVLHHPAETNFKSLLPAETAGSLQMDPLRLGPVFFAGRSPFRVSVMILTCFAIPEHAANDSGKYITYVGYKKATESEFDFDEMIHSDTFEMAEKTHHKACGFFGNSKLFVEALI